jgi:tetratricopeptide (TPR) repeat protein
VKARPNEPCSCGSGKKYKKCCGQDPPRAPGPRAEPTPAQLASLTALLNANRHAQLEGAVRDLLDRYPRTGFLWKVLGLALWAQGKDALPALERAVALLPQDAEAHGNLGNAYRSRGRAEDAAASHRRALAIRPNYAEAHNNLGSALRDLGRLDEAEASYRRALAMRGDFAMAHANLAETLRLSGKLEEAASSYADALILRPADAELHNRLGSVLCDLGRLEQAEQSCRRALALKPGLAELHSNLATLLMAQHRISEGEESARRALELDPSLTAALVLLAELEAGRGEFAAAERLIERAIGIDPDMPEAWAALGRWRRGSQEDDAWRRQAERLVAGALPPRREVRLRYALGKYFDDIREYDQAFGHYRRANELTRTCNAPYERGAFTRQVDLITQLQDRAWLAQTRSDTPGSSRAVFLVGMWRSGTTLAEQILASHPGVVGAGEVGYWVAAAAPGQNSSRTPEADDLDTLRGIAAEYLALLQQASTTAERVVDKMSSNFLHLGVIHAALPEARIIHMRRDPRDTCLSIYFQDLLYGHRYANDLEDLAQYYRDYARLMEHWRTLLPPQVLLEVPYEALVADPETWSRRMLDFIGLDWDARCLDFQYTPRTVMSSSKWQVRQPLHHSSVGRWRNYERFLGPLLSLGDLSR